VFFVSGFVQYYLFVVVVVVVVVVDLNIQGAKHKIRCFFSVCLISYSPTPFFLFLLLLDEMTNKKRSTQQTKMINKIKKYTSVFF
jgi:hypothetical protein